MTNSKEYSRQYREKNREKLNANLKKHREKKKKELDYSIYDNHKKPWDKEDEDYLWEWYKILGTTQLSYELGRTYASVKNKYVELRNKKEKQNERI